MNPTFIFDAVLFDLDGFLEAARRLNVRPSRAVVVEEALVGIVAGRAGDFGEPLCLTPDAPLHRPATPEQQLPRAA